jgi:outer membrane biosynthesis protein TonB
MVVELWYDGKTVTTRYSIRIELALALSALLHLAGAGAWHFRESLGRFPLFRPLEWLVALPERKAVPAADPVPSITFIEVAEPKREKPKPRTFVETDNRQVTGEKPKEADFYSDRDTVAANQQNPDKRETDMPYLEGTHEKVMSTEDVPTPSAPAAPPPMPELPPPQPTPTEPVKVANVEPPKPIVPEPSPVKPPQPPPADKGLKLYEEAKLTEPVPALPPSTAKPLMPAQKPAPPSSPSTSQPATESSAREIAAPKTKLTAAGVGRTGVAAFNVASSPFGDYDKKVVRAVQSRWYALINRYGIYERAGTVTIHFELLDDGSVQKLSVSDNSAGEILALYCQKAILDSSPFDPFPDELRVLVGKEPREVDFTFFY